MVKFVYKNLLGNNNYAGPRAMGWKPKGVVIHNTAGSYYGGSDNAAYYMNSYLPNAIKTGAIQNGFAHYYCDKDLVFQCCDTRYGAWATATTDGNMNYVSYEVCEPGNKEDFLANEQATFQQVAKDMEFWGLEPNRSTVKLHQQFSSTACPWLSVKYHGGVQSTQDYFISQIKKYMNSQTSTPEGTQIPKPNKPSAPENPTYYHSSKVKALKIKNETYLYDGVALSKAKKLKKLTPSTTKEYKVLKIWKQGNKEKDMSRFYIDVDGTKGWVTGNTFYIDSVYYIANSYGQRTRVKLRKYTYACSDKELSKGKVKVKKGEVFTVVDNVADKNGYARLKLKSGKYITARKDFVEFVK